MISGSDISMLVAIAQHDREWASTKDVMEQTGFCKQTVYRRANKLKNVGLVETLVGYNNVRLYRILPIYVQVFKELSEILGGLEDEK